MLHMHTASCFSFLFTFFVCCTCCLIFSTHAQHDTQMCRERAAYFILAYLFLPLLLHPSLCALSSAIGLRPHRGSFFLCRPYVAEACTDTFLYMHTHLKGLPQLAIYVYTTPISPWQAETGERYPEIPTLFTPRGGSFTQRRKATLYAPVWTKEGG
jgi:hypothetical protein